MPLVFEIGTIPVVRRLRVAPCTCVSNPSGDEEGIHHKGAEDTKNRNEFQFGTGLMVSPAANCAW
jgi:hypothetical protein